MISQRTLSLCLITIFVSACNTQQQDETEKKVVSEHKVPEISTLVETAKKPAAIAQKKPAMKLSIENMAIDEPAHNEDFLQTGMESSDTDNNLFGRAYRKKPGAKINLSGKLFTDDVRLENREYLQAVDGVQINIGGEFN